MTGLNFVDIIILIIFGVSALVGLKRGLVSEVVSLVTLIAAFVIAILFSNSLATYFTSSSSVQEVVSSTSSAIGTNTAQPVSYIALGISFGLLFAGTSLIGMLIKSLLNIAVQAGMLGIGNRLLGAIFGLARGFLINLVLIFVVQLSSFGNSAWWHQSQWVNSFQPAVVWLGSVVSPSLAQLKSKFQETVQGMGTQIQNLTR